MSKTFRGSLELDTGKTITVDCDRPYKPCIEEATATIRAMFERLCTARGWKPLWDKFSVEAGDLAVRA